MNEAQRTQLKHLRSLSSEAAATHLLTSDPNGETALALLPHLSWKVSDQKRLAAAYLSNLPHANAKAYDAFASFMSLQNFIAAIRPHLTPLLTGRDKPRMDLLNDYLAPVLRERAKSEGDRARVEALLRELE